MFDRIAPVYDAMNRVMTVGLDVRWRRLAAAAAVTPGAAVLDAACGTGDLAIADLKAGAAKVTGLDFSEQMLVRARRKEPRIEWVQGDMLALPFEDASFDAATVGFGVRNVADLERALAELRRVLRPGGKLAILEITQPRGPLRPFFSLWFDRVVPLLGKVLPGTLVHDDLVDGARRRRALPAAWSVYGADAAKAAGDYLYACAFAVLAETGDERAVRTLADAALCLARGEAMQKLQTNDPDTPIAAYLERCSLKTGKLIEAACLLASGGDPALGAYGAALGLAFQIADDILDCAGQTQETGKIPGTDLREGTPTMPLLYAAQRDPDVRAALAGGSVDGALVRVGLTDALARSCEAALDYSPRARSFLDSDPHRDVL